MTIADEQDKALRLRLEELRTEHRDLDEASAALTGNASPDQLRRWHKNGMLPARGCA